MRPAQIGPREIASYTKETKFKSKISKHTCERLRKSVRREMTTLKASDARDTLYYSMRRPKRIIRS